MVGPELAAMVRLPPDAIERLPEVSFNQRTLSLFVVLIVPETEVLIVTVSLMVGTVPVDQLAGLSQLRVGALASQLIAVGTTLPSSSSIPNRQIGVLLWTRWVVRNGFEPK